MSILDSVTANEGLRNYAKRGARAGLFVRGAALERWRADGLRNVYAATIQKAGSQWSKAVFSHPSVRHASGLRQHPQFRYDRNEYMASFPARTFVPGLYLSYQEYSRISKLGDYRTFYMLRDPRSIVVSWYHSMLSSHRLMGDVGKHRQALCSLPKESGLRYCIEVLAPKLIEMMTWVGVNDPAVRVFRLESFRSDDLVARLDELLTHCEVRLGEEDLVNLAESVSREKVRERDIAHRADGLSHYRPTPSRFELELSESLLDEFYARTGNLVEVLGYSR